jgi:hypothetical protein
MDFQMGFDEMICETMKRREFRKRIRCKHGSQGFVELEMNVFNDLCRRVRTINTLELQRFHTKVIPDISFGSPSTLGLSNYFPFQHISSILLIHIDRNRRNLTVRISSVLSLARSRVGSVPRSPPQSRMLMTFKMMINKCEDLDTV